MSARVLRWLAVPVTAGVLVLGGCSRSAEVQPATPPPVVVTGAAPAATPAPAVRRVDRVIAISVDGLNPRAITQLGPGRTPAFHRMLAEGSATLNARTAYEQTKTLPNHTGMLTGRRIAAGDHGHGVDFNRFDDSVPRTVHAAAGGYVASVFDVVHDHGGSTALYSAKTKFRLYAQTWNDAGAPDRVGEDDGHRKIDRVRIDTDHDDLVAALTDDLASAPATFTFLHLSLPDRAGHRDGFMGRSYLTAVQQTDGLLDQVLDAVAGEPELAQHTLIVLTADHGGNGPSHGEAGELQNYRIPFVIWGAGVGAGHDLYADNPEFTDPGRSRITYRGRQPIRNQNVANLVTGALELPAVPGSQVDRRQSLDPLAG